eukprot:TRINITY_DN21534_c0_g1_i1.p1 TRINITY_DN21534_c0_g1~~TRINITY_DN21534_c0_g1_i1.p1  ORF type:complete len:341 (-),score=52.12 TRINITY_DN21534_c0_g1_i1:459-1481(-)
MKAAGGQTTVAAATKDTMTDRAANRRRLATVVAVPCAAAAAVGCLFLIPSLAAAVPVSIALGAVVTTAVQQLSDAALERFTGAFSRYQCARILILWPPGAVCVAQVPVGDFKFPNWLGNNRGRYIHPEKILGVNLTALCAQPLAWTSGSSLVRERARELLTPIQALLQTLEGDLSQTLMRLLGLDALIALEVAKYEDAQQDAAATEAARQANAAVQRLKSEKTMLNIHRNLLHLQVAFAYCVHGYITQDFVNALVREVHPLREKARTLAAAVNRSDAGAPEPEVGTRYLAIDAPPRSYVAETIAKVQDFPVDMRKACTSGLSMLHQTVSGGGLAHVQGVM